MSDSEWEVLSSDGEGQPGSKLSSANPTPPTTASRTEAGTTSDTLPPSRLPPAIDRRTILKPLCLSLNQTGTRLGVGHTTGYLVFRVRPAEAAADATPAAPPHTASMDAHEMRLPAQSQLVLDPQYNVDLLTFSRVRERLQQQRLRRQQLAALAAAATTAATEAGGPTPEAAPMESARRPTVASKTRATALHNDKGATQAPSDAMVRSVDVPRRSLNDERTNDADGEGDAEEYAASPPLDLDDLGSFLTAAGRAFAQLKRDDALSEPHAPSMYRKKELRAHASHTMPTACTMDHAPLEAQNAHCAEALTVRETPTTDLFLTSPSLTALASSPVFDWGEDEDIDVDAEEGSVNDIPLSSIGDSAMTRRKRTKEKRLSDRGAADPVDGTRNAAFNQSHGEAGVEEEEEEEEDGYVGFEGGGVAVMAFLYEQTWLALVGGGSTPMGPPNIIQFVRDGAPQHRLILPNPVVQLFLDARLLFVVTTAELRVYTNALEESWVCLRQVLPMSASRAARYAAVTLAPMPTQEGSGDGGGGSAMGDIAPPLRVWGAPSEEERGQHFTQVKNASFATPSMANSGVSFPQENQRDAGLLSTVESSKSVALPSIPVVVDYARSLLLMPVGESAKGFALYRYVSGPEPVDRRTSDALGNASNAAHAAPSQQSNTFTANATSATTGRTTVYLEHIATQLVAHQNPLHNLVLYVGWPAATARLLSTEAPSSAASSQETSTSGWTSSPPPHPQVTSRGSFGWDGTRGGAVTLVAASSEYATRLTLWMLRPEDEHHRDPRPGSLPGADSLAGAPAAGQPVCFVLLREFRVGLRLTPPRMVMAVLPGVSRLMTRAQQTHPSLSTSTSSLAQESRRGGRAPVSSREAAESHLNASATSAGAFALPVDAASTSAMSSYRGTVATWASEAASVVTAANTFATPSVHHLQFLGNGAYLLCVHGTDTISVFSTSAPETEQEAKDVTRDRAAAEQNRYSRLAVMKEYLPKALSNRLDAYTRQAWSSCTGYLPSYDVTFVPRWLYLKQQDIAAEAAAAAAATAAAATSAGSRSDTRANSTSSRVAAGSMTRGPARQDAASPPPTAKVTTGTSSEAPVGGRRFFQRLSALVGARPQQQQAPEPLNRSAAEAHAVPYTQRSSEMEASADAAPLIASTDPCGTNGGVGGVLLAVPAPSHKPEVFWGTPLTELSRCLRIWSGGPHASHATDMGHGVQKSTSSGGSGAGARRPLVLNCATCEGAYTNVFLFAEDGDVVTSSVLPYTTDL